MSLETEENVDHVFVPNDLIGLIIGRGGERIRQIQEDANGKSFPRRSTGMIFFSRFLSLYSGTSAHKTQQQESEDQYKSREKRTS